MENQVKAIPIILPNGALVMVETTILDDLQEGEIIETDISATRPLKEITDAIEGIAIGISTGIKEALLKAQPATASVEFSLEFGCEGTRIIPMLVQGSSKFQLKIALSWKQD